MRVMTTPKLNSIMLTVAPTWRQHAGTSQALSQLLDTASRFTARRLFMVLVGKISSGRRRQRADYSAPCYERRIISNDSSSVIALPHRLVVASRCPLRRRRDGSRTGAILDVGHHKSRCKSEPLSQVSLLSRGQESQMSEDGPVGFRNDGNTRCVLVSVRRSRT